MDFASPQQSEAAIDSALYDIIEGTSDLALPQGDFALQYIVWSVCITTAAKLNVI
jgi:hypothetical protein